MNKFPEHSSPEQTLAINELLGRRYNMNHYTISDIFNILPERIEVGDRVGYLRISKIDIVYSSLETEMNGKVTAMFQFLIDDKNVFDAFIAALLFLGKHNIIIGAQ